MHAPHGLARRALACVLALPLAATIAGCADMDNPPATRAPQWIDGETEALARRACIDCHSNETKWPFYAYLPIVGALVSNDVHEARDKLNFSEWDREQDGADDVGEVIRDGEMPLPLYVAAHPEAKLTDEEREQLADGLERTIAADPPPGFEPDDDEEDDDD